jgi:hypothetical protein
MNNTSRQQQARIGKFKRARARMLENKHEFWLRRASAGASVVVKLLSVKNAAILHRLSRYSVQCVGFGHSLLPFNENLRLCLRLLGTGSRKWKTQTSIPCHTVEFARSSSARNNLPTLQVSFGSSCTTIRGLLEAQSCGR